VGRAPKVALLTEAQVAHPGQKAVFAVNRQISDAFLSRAVLDAVTIYRPCAVWLADLARGVRVEHRQQLDGVRP
jgi:hypothetical protein